MKIGILADEEQFMIDVANLLRSRNYEVEYMRLKYQKLPLPTDYKLIIDRFSLYDNFVRTIVKALSLNGVYVINNPFSNICDDKVIEYTICQKLKIPYPFTFVLPQENTAEDVTAQVETPNLDSVIEGLQFPMVLKPHDGYAWTDVIIVNNPDELKRTYENLKRTHVLLLQQHIPYKLMYRVYCFGQKETLFVRYDPASKTYLVDDCSAIQDIKKKIEDCTKKLNKALDYDFNAVEWMIDNDNNFFLIDAFNETPELLPESIPRIYYDQIVQKFADLAEQRYNSNARNNVPFDYP